MVHGASAEEAYRNYIENRRAKYRNEMARYERERLARQAAWLEFSEAQHKQILAGDFCRWYKLGSGRIAAKTVNHILANCAIMDDSFVNYARSLGADLALIAKADYAVRKARGEFEWKPPPAPPHIYATPNWAAWGDAMVKSARDSTDAFICDSKRRYFSNVEAWNRGKQNWCC